MNMKRNLGIRGDEDHGSEVIALLKSLGGVDTGTGPGPERIQLNYTSLIEQQALSMQFLL